MNGWRTAVCATTVVVAACRPPASGPAGGAGGAARPADDPAPGGRAAWFEERSAETGLAFRHVNGASGRFFYPEILGPGVGLLDYDNDGDLDVYLVQGGVLGSPPAGEVWLPAAAEAPSGGRLFRNDLPPGGPSSALHFTDVTDASGIRATGFGLGVAAGDVDNDGWVDLYLTTFGAAQLWRNRRDGTFEDITQRSGTANLPGFGVSAAFVDYDRDGWLDLYVGNNVDYRLDREKACPGPTGARDYCPPQIYGGRPDRLYRNRGGGRFQDVTSTALVGGRFGPALGVATADFNGDGWIDIYVANDGEPNLLWMNQRDGTFREWALAAGAALTAEGKAESSMGVDAGDLDDDGDEDLLMTELTGEGTNVFVNDGRGMFQDASAATGVGPASMPFTGWGTAWADFDFDGALDTLAVNGTIIAVAPFDRRSFPYGQTRTLMRNAGGARFTSVVEGGTSFAAVDAGRGAAFGDVDNDGDVDVVVGNNAGAARLLVNRAGTARSWIGVKLIGTDGRRDMLGARVAVRLPDGTTRWRRARSDGSYASANDPRVVVGLGDHAEPVTAEVIWPDGQREVWSSLGARRWHTLEQGRAR